jgi:PBP1b-binding outer membrane lipoprotein LpoB
MSKLIFHIFLLTLIITSCNNNQKKDNGLEEVRLDGKTTNADIVRMPITADTPLDTNNIAKITLEETDFNFGSVTEGDVVKHTYKFKNVGNQTLLITDIRTTCGCTVPTWNKSPIAAGASDQVEVKFDTKGKANEQVKKITIIANTFPAETELILRGMVQVSK